MVESDVPQMAVGLSALFILDN